MAKKFFAVMHCKPKQSAAVNKLCTRVIKYLGDNAADFATPNPTILILTNENAKLTSLIGEAKGNTLKKDARDAQSIVVYNLLQNEIIYVDGVAKGNKVLIDESGFDASLEPHVHTNPDKPVIKKIVDGKAPATAKILIEKGLGTGLLFTAQTTLTPAVESSWVTMLDHVSRPKLILIGLVRAQEIFVRVRAADGSLKGDYSTPVPFIAR